MRRQYILPLQPSPLRHSHPCLSCLSPTYARSVFEGGFEPLRPSVRPAHAFAHNTQRRTAAAGRRMTLYTYIQPWRGTARGLQSFGACTPTCSAKATTCHADCTYCSSGLQQQHLIIICTEDVTAARRSTLQRLLISSGTRLRLPRRVTLARVPTDWYFLFSACGVDMLPPRRSPLQLDMRWEFKPFFNKGFSDLCTRSEEAVFLIVSSYQKMLSENVLRKDLF